MRIFHLAVNIYDKYLCFCNFTSNHLQLLATASIFISCKYESVFTPKITWLLNSMEDSSTKKDFLEMELNILRALNFNLGFPAVNVFLSNFAEVLSLEKRNYYLASYYCELSLLTTSSYQFSASCLAAASIVLANVVLKCGNPWPQCIILFCNLELVDLEECIGFIDTLARAAPDFSPAEGARNKFGDWQFDSVSKLDQPENFER